MEAVKPVYLLLICQGFYLGSVGQRWTFPDEVTALIGSCVEIPCTYDPVGTSGPASTVWYLYASWGYPKILNIEDSSSVLKDYRNRTSLVPGQGCTLRIDPVRRGDGNKYYYPGIAEDKYINAYEKQSKYVSLYVTDKLNIKFSGPETMSEGKATTIQCSADHTCGSSPPTIQWNKPGGVTQKSVEKTGGSWTEESILTYIPTYEDDGSDIQCTATYPNGGKTNDSITLNVYYPPKSVTVTIIGKDEVKEGSHVTLQCNSVSNPGVYRYEWYNGKEKTKLPYTRREITVRKVTWNMEPYSCTAINRVGRGESALMDIPVLYPPKNVTVTIIGKDEVMEGSHVTLQCNSISNPDVYEYQWYKGKEKSRLQDTGREIIVRNVTRNMEPYSCTAINTVGRGESALMEIPVPYEGSSISNIILPATIGTICLLFLILLVYCCWRKKTKKFPSNETKTLPDATYTDLLKRDENIYEQVLVEDHKRASSCVPIGHNPLPEKSITTVSLSTN